jgi:YHS domain-containing protein
MRGLLIFLLYGLFFYLMMRFGCGSHMVHGHGGHEHEGGQGASSVDVPAIDPVCGMQVEPGHGYMKSHEGRLLHFCSRKCLDSFEAEPQRYAA